MIKNYQLNSKDKLSKLAKSKGVKTWNELIEFVKNIPYGRNKNRMDFSLVLSENKGTCSSKHALLKKIADFNKIQNVQLILGIYKMNTSNTPKIGNVLINNAIGYIPEAHCYLKINNNIVDVTSKKSDFQKIKHVILVEKEIEAEQVSVFKMAYHKKFLQNWILENNILHSFEKIWQLREQCIKNLENRY